MTKKEIIRRVNKMSKSYGLRAEIHPDAFSVGVKGDERSVTQIVNLIGKFPGFEKLGQLASKICNTLPINRVTYEIQISGKQSPSRSS